MRPGMTPTYPSTFAGAGCVAGCSEAWLVEAWLAIRAALAETGVALAEHPTLEAATLAASAIAEPGDAVLLSPACASFDMFKDYAHRADVFRGAVHDIAAQRGTML